jgi:tRNA-specific 2-thiouridylase
VQHGFSKPERYRQAGAYFFPHRTHRDPMNEALEHYLADRSRVGPAIDGGATGAAGGAPCGDLVRISLVAAGGTVERVTVDAEGCAPSRAAAAAVAELVEGASVLDAARLSPVEVAAELGGLADTHLHSAELAADALHRAITELAATGESLAAPPASGERVAVAVSGGVDSAVAALRERERGADVVAVTVKLWADEATDGERSCCSPEAVLKARRVAHSLGLPHLTLDLRGEFRAGVVRPFIDGYAAGRTPNPCVLCNGEVRIDAMIALADRLGASALATGHYARLVDDGEGPLLSRPADESKDQTYMLAAIAPQSLRRLRFPLGDLTKPEVRALAAEAGLEVAGRAESQDLCFLAGQGKRAFLRRHAGLGERPGEIVDASGERVGRHRGQHEFTVGQRRGLGVAAAEPLYVLETDAAANTVTVGAREELRAGSVRIRGASLHRAAGRVNRVRLRYRSPARECKVELGEGGEGLISLSEPADRAAPGQIACLMDGDVVVGHGTVA